MNPVQQGCLGVKNKRLWCSGEQPLARLWSKIQAAEDALARLAQLQVSQAHPSPARDLPQPLPAASPVWSAVTLPAKRRQ